MRPPLLRPIAILTLAAVLAGAAAGCSRDRSTPDGAPVGLRTQGATPAGTAPAAAYPIRATKNTTRIDTPAGAERNAAVARVVYPGTERTQRAPAVALADADDWRAAIAAAVLMAPPLRAPLLLTDSGETPAATAAALADLAPVGSPRANGAQAIRLGTAGDPPGDLRTTSIAGDDAFTLAANIAEYRSRVAGRRSAAVVVTTADDPAFAMPAAAYAAKSGDPVLFVARDGVPAPTRAAIRTHGRPRIYLLGPVSAISANVERQLSSLGTVTRIAGANPVTNAIEFARFRDAGFGWGVVDPGHGLVFANPSTPADAGASAPLSATGTFGPLLLTAADGGLPAALAQYLLDIKPGYSSDPVRGVYNHGWIVGAPDTVAPRAQATIDGLLEIARVPQPKATP